MKESGLLTKMIHDYYPLPPDCSDASSNADGYKPVSILYVYPAYVILAFGYIIAIALFSAEIMFYSFSFRKEKYLFFK